MEKSKNSYRRFPIDNKVTLKVLAEKTGIEKQQLIDFHNIFASPKEHISEEHTPNLTFLYVPANFHYLYSGLSINSGLNLFLYNKPSIESNQYYVEYLKKQGEKQTRISFDVQVEHKKTINNEYHLFEVSKLTPTTLNGEVENNDVQEINEKINNIIYPLQVITNDNGSFKEVLYPENIKKQWDKLKKELQEEYSGMCFSHIIDYNDQILKDKDKFVESFKDFWLLKTLFPSIYSLYNFNGGVYEVLDFELINEELPLQYKVYKSFTNIDTTGNLLKFDYKGNLTDKRSRMELEWLTNNPSFQEYNNLESKGIFEQSVIWDNESKKIKNINVQAILELETPIVNTISIRLMEEEG